MSPMDRLLREAVPVRPTPTRPAEWTDADRDRHWAALCEAVGTPGAERPTARQAAA